MSDVVAAVKKLVGSAGSTKAKVKDQGSSFQFSGKVGAHLVVRIDDLTPDQRGTARDRGVEDKKADYLVFMECADCLRFFVWIIEMKSGRNEMEKAAKQLQKGAELAGKLAPAGKLFEFIPLLIHGRKAGPNHSALRVLASKRVEFRKVKRAIHLLKDGSDIAKVLGDC